MQNVAQKQVYSPQWVIKRGDSLQNYSAKNWPLGLADDCSPFVFKKSEWKWIETEA